MNVEAAQLGGMKLAQSEVLEFPKSLFGFEGVHRYALVGGRKGSPFKWLRAVEHTDLAFVVIEAEKICPDYELQMSYEDAAALGWPDGDFGVLAIVGIPDNPEEISANLKGPIVFDRQRRIGRQVIQPGDRYSPRFRIVEAMQRQRQKSIHAATVQGSSPEGGIGGIHR